jgi:hypothetical protein
MATGFLNIQTPIIPDDPSYVSHVYWDGQTIHDSRVSLTTWTQVGVVPQNAQSLTAGYPAGAGLFSDANYYAASAASDSLDSTGDRFGCIVFIPPVTDATNRVLLNNGNSGVAGYTVQIVGTTGVFSFTSAVPAAQGVSSANTVVSGVINVGCWWRTGNNIFSQLNLGAVAVTAAGAAEVSGTANVMKIGRYEAGGNPFLGSIIEIVQGLGTPPGAAIYAQPTNNLGTATPPASGVIGWAQRVQQIVLDKCGLANAWEYPIARYGNFERT